MEVTQAEKPKQVRGRRATRINEAPKKVKAAAKPKVTKTKAAQAKTKKTVAKNNSLEVVTIPERSELAVYKNYDILGTLVSDKIIPQSFLDRGYNSKWCQDTIEDYLSQEGSILNTIKAPKNNMGTVTVLNPPNTTNNNDNINDSDSRINATLPSRNPATLLGSWLEIVKSVPAIASIWQSARHIKAQLYEEKSLQALENAFNGLDKSCFTISQYRDSKGVLKTHKVLTSAGVSYLKTLSDAYLQRARSTERGHMNEKNKEEIHNIVVNNNVKIDLRDIMSRDITELAELSTM